MNALLVVIAVVAIVLLLTGGFVPTLNFLLWVGIVLLVIAVIVFLARTISGRRSYAHRLSRPAGSVRKVGLEPTRLSAQEPKSCVSTISPLPRAGEVYGVTAADPATRTAGRRR